MKYFLLAMALTFLTLFSPSMSAADNVPASRTWLERPWEIRYVLFAGPAQSMRITIEVSKENNAKQLTAKKERIYLSAASLFKPTMTLSAPGEEPVTVIVLAFDSVGRVINQQAPLNKMSAKRSVLGYLALIDNASSESNPYYFADWSQGIPGDVTFSPAVCNLDDTHRYEDGWDSDSYTGSFGCREWTAQLYARDQPYIDVTSYASHGTFIGELVGWSRFEDPPKPVIGRHGKTWLCLHECPAGEKPGVIPNIKAWTTKHGYPMPERPRKQPLYPNADYADDLNE